MTRKRLQIRAVTEHLARRVLPVRAALAAALWLLFIHAAPAQDSGLQQPDGVRGGAEAIDNNQAVAESTLDAGAFTEDAENLPLPSSPRVEGTLPLAGWDADVDISQGRNGRIDRLVVRDASLSRVLALLAQTYHLNIVASNDIDAVISITLRDVALEEALTAILSVANYTWVERDGIILITSMTDSGQLPAEIQGRRIQVFELDFASASVLSEAVTGFLSPIGKLSVTESDSSDNRRTRDMIVVEDVAESLDRIAAYIHQVDQPPRQVLLEAHILQVTLKDTEKNGVNFNALLRAAGSSINLKTVGLAPAATATGPAFYATVAGGDLGSVIELLQATTDTKTLGSPKILVLNQQEATIHVGETIGYQTTVTTQTTSTGQAQFLNVGVTLLLLPRITRDGRVLLHVEPEVSTGQFNPISQAPDKQTTELETDVMLDDGQGMVIGGLIKENDSTTQSKIPYLGDLWRAGFFFRKSEVTKERVEIIVAIVPRIQPYDSEFADFEQGELVEAETPLFQGPLCYTDRPWDAKLPDGKRLVKPYIPRRPMLPEVDRSRPNYCNAPWPQYYVPHKPYPEQHFNEDCAEPSLEYPDTWPQAQPVLTGEIVPEIDEHTTSEDSVISDQP